MKPLNPPFTVSAICWPYSHGLLLHSIPRPCENQRTDTLYQPGYRVQQCPDRYRPALMLIFYGPAQLITGWVCDRVGSRRVMIFSIIAWSLLTYWQGNVRSVEEWYFRMVLFGLMIGTEFIPSTRLIVRYFPPLQRARGQSVLSWSWIVTPAWAPSRDLHVHRSWQQLARGVPRACFCRRRSDAFDPALRP